jgi:hypothetical protein
MKTAVSNHHSGPHAVLLDPTSNWRVDFSIIRPFMRGGSRACSKRGKRVFLYAIEDAESDTK